MEPRAAGYRSPKGQAWAAADPAGLCRWLIQRGIPPDHELLLDLFTGWARQDRDAAFTAALNLPPDFQNHDQVPGLWDTMLGTVLTHSGGLQAGWKWVLLMDGDQKDFLVPGPEWLNFSPSGEIAAFLKAHAGDRMYACALSRDLVKFWMEKDRPAVIAWVRSLTGELRRWAFSGLMESWSKEAPAEALAYFKREASTEDRREVTMALRALAEKDPVAALNWYERNLGVANWSTLREIFAVWCRADNREGLDYVLSMEDSALRSQHLLAWGAEADAASVLKICLRMPEGADREILLEAFGNNSNTWSMETEDIRSLLEKEPPERITEKMATAVGASCAARNPEALTWAGTLPAERQRAAAEAIFRNWDNRAAAAKALDQLPESAFKSKARQAWYYLMPRAPE